ncbi:hypothetical protein ALP73_00532 [Pseudomonas coronafaciens pv. garcae]|uniref:Phage tail protein n=2 Tax=Pseudomonas syringae group TaxID=136849 RepID=A0AB37QQY2_9PSED|nr:MULTISPECIES: hypothetical protein [Pseudomonas syringae group]KGS14702.1 hypothetical protein OA77_09715 [Pseudomonas coronafaciens]AZG84976.1 hypothetical protein N032_04490 [Pseudomonas syringae pv. pisi str. PP1]RMM30546.1 hypothetical protein ALQ81_00772 [Pseudomonas syringae pv. pisi]RMO00680.1 hypothetical protein ALQ50_200055 [Pseudomonas coronafaciens pv. coronafaciens]RMS01088.1 hypothetical protein ALP74_01641 [Pseudomonas coronafaciens pv. garcae]
MTNEIVKTETLPSIVELQYEVALQAPDVRAALFDCEGAQARRDSISRKLCSGSTTVTVRDLERWEKALSDAKKVLMQISPILERHPICASVVAHS